MDFFHFFFLPKNNKKCRYSSYDFSWQIRNCCVIFKSRRAVIRIYVIIYIISFVAVYNFLNLYLFNKTKNKVLINNKNVKTHKFNFQSSSRLNSYKNKVKETLSNLEHPYKINLKKYFFIKYIFSPVISIIAYINYRNAYIPIFLFLLSFYSVNYLIYQYKKEEKIKLINEIRNFNLNLVLYLSAYTPLKTALKYSIKALSYERFLKSMEKFVYLYEATGYNLIKSIRELENKFDSHELCMFLNLLKQGEKEGKLIENLERFGETLELSYFKYVKRQSSKQLAYVSIGTVLLLGNIALIVMYPLAIEIINSLQTIFS